MRLINALTATTALLAGSVAAHDMDHKHQANPSSSSSITVTNTGWNASEESGHTFGPVAETTRSICAICARDAVAQIGPETAHPPHPLNTGPGSSSSKNILSTGWSYSEESSRTTRQHMHTVTIADITTVSEIIEDVTITKTAHETAVVSKSGEAPYTTLIHGQHRSQSEHLKPTSPRSGNLCGASTLPLQPPSPQTTIEASTASKVHRSLTTISRSDTTLTRAVSVTPSQAESASVLQITSLLSVVGTLVCHGKDCSTKAGPIQPITASENFWTSLATVSATDRTYTRTFTFNMPQPESTETASVTQSASVGPVSPGAGCSIGQNGADICLFSQSSTSRTTLTTSLSTQSTRVSSTSSADGSNTNSHMKRAVVIDNPRLILASWVSASYLWPSGVSPFMTPTAAPVASADCWSSVDFTFELYTQPHAGTEAAQSYKNGLVSRSENTPVTLSLVNGTLIDGQSRIGDIVANGQFQFDAPPQAGTIYDGGWSLCNPGEPGSAYRLSLGANMTFFQCNSGGFDNLYAWPLTNACTEVDLLIVTEGRVDTPSTTTKPDSITVPLNRRSAATTSNQWAHTVEFAGQKYTIWDSYPIFTVSGTVYSAQPTTAYFPVAVGPIASVEKRDVDNDIEFLLNYEYNTYTYTVPAETGVDPSYSDSPEVTWTLPQRVITVTEAPYTLTTAASASVAVRDAAPKNLEPLETVTQIVSTAVATVYVPPVPCSEASSLPTLSTASTIFVFDTSAMPTTTALILDTWSVASSMATTSATETAKLSSFPSAASTTAALSSDTAVGVELDCPRAVFMAFGLAVFTAVVAFSL